MNGAKGSLRKRITLIVVTGVSIILIGLGIASHSIIEKNIDDSLNRKQALSRLVRNNIDTIMKDNINRLYDISLSGAVDLGDGDFRPEKEAVKTAYRYSIFTDGVFLLDRKGTMLLDYPGRIGEVPFTADDLGPAGRALSLGKPVVSNVTRIDPSGRETLYVLTPLQDKNGFTVGIAGGRIDTSNPVLLQKLGLIDMGRNETIDVVDSNGVVLASSVPSRMFRAYNRGNFFSTLIKKRRELVTACYSCHAGGGAKDRVPTILAFSPLETAPWGISIQEPRAEVFSPVASLQRTFVALGVFFMGIALLLTIGINRSIVDPLKDLIRSAERIAKGNLAEPISPEGSDEIGVLSRSFETMRLKLVGSLERIMRQNSDLERRVEERTRQIEESRRQTEVLLKKIITTQEDERKRIARELHDATLQDLSAALMRIDLCALQPDRTVEKDANRIREIVLNAWDGVLGVIRNLRPALLDDLGLIAAIDSLLETHLGKAGIAYVLDAKEVQDLRFRPEAEITLFRIVQEAIMNIARYAKAENVSVLFDRADDALCVEIEDDGAGFDPAAVFSPAEGGTKDRRGLGLMGMRERAGLLNGALEVHSCPGAGTKIRLRVPLAASAVADA
jgi:signal transduction histidine kinase